MNEQTSPVEKTAEPVVVIPSGFFVGGKLRWRTRDGWGDARGVIVVAVVPRGETVKRFIPSGFTLANGKGYTGIRHETSYLVCQPGTKVLFWPRTRHLAE